MILEDELVGMALDIIKELGLPGSEIDKVVEHLKEEHEANGYEIV